MNEVSTTLVIPDTHVPYEDPQAFEVLLKAIDDIKPQELVFIGDFADFYAVSFHSKDPRREKFLVGEVEKVNKRLDEIDSIGAASRDVVFIEGNHEDRLRRYISDKAPELEGLVDVNDLFKFKERNYKHIKYRDHYKHGKVYYTHDSGRSGKYAVFHTLGDYGANVVFGHSHRGGVVYSGEMRGNSHASMNVGWLGSIASIDYKHKARALRDWQQGFGLVRYDKQGYGWMNFVPIIRGKACY